MWHRVQTVSTTAPDSEGAFLFGHLMRVRRKEHASMSSSSQLVPSTPDVLVRNEGTVFLFCPLTSRGKQWIEEHVQPDALWFGSTLAPRFERGGMSGATLGLVLAR